MPNLIRLMKKPILLSMSNSLRFAWARQLSSPWMRRLTTKYRLTNFVTLITDTM
ncbi:secreted protein [Candidatus Thiomargarita nelsonii]|uniref:Secreted protein n=1 Tax=Candidatus Thiomargarita nelsonii TaxID=1003181 RepID=A0A176S7G9_9GAMM|nr:secreted protein [Candidatus Thiomargarita nelsonii]